MPLAEAAVCILQVVAFLNGSIFVGVKGAYELKTYIVNGFISQKRKPIV